MGGKGKKKGKKQKQATASAGVAEEGGEENGEGNGSKKGKKGKKGKAGKSSKFQGDIFSEAAMENAYYVCHNLMDVLKVRTFFIDFHHFLSLIETNIKSYFRLAALHGRNHKRKRRKERNNDQTFFMYPVLVLFSIVSTLTFSTRNFLQSKFIRKFFSSSTLAIKLAKNFFFTHLLINSGTSGRYRLVFYTKFFY